MKKLATIFTIMICTSLQAQVADRTDPDTNPIVQTKSGTIRGTKDGMLTALKAFRMQLLLLENSVGDRLNQLRYGKEY